MKQMSISFFFLLIVGVNAVYSQDSETNQKDKSYFQAGIKYLSDNVYLGRKDSATVSYITPTIGYYHKSGVYITGGASYQPNNGANRIDLITIEAGYDYSIKDKFYGGFYAGKYFYSGDSYAVNAEVNTGIGTYGSYNFGWITANAGAGVSISSKSDFITEAGLSKSIVDKKEKFEMVPTIKFNAGSQNYYNEYYKSGRAVNAGIANKRGRGRGSSGGTGTTTTPATTSIIEAARFKIMDYEFSLPLSYTADKFKIKFIPIYAVPVNPASIQTDQGIIKEGLSNHFFAELELTYKF
ncbi:MAG: hypothetical protein ACM3H8_04860 [Sphingobacteriales bacterium]